jgi:hypothetical protein
MYQMEKQVYLECALIIIVTFFLVGGLAISLTYSAYAEISPIHRWVHNTTKWFAADSGLDTDESIRDYIIFG